LSDDNALIFQRKFFPRTSKNRIPDPSEYRALEFKGEFRRFGCWSISTTIGINRSIFSLTAADEPTTCNSKKDRHEAIHDRSASRGGYRFAKL
jgi:hypothetical protein